ncbi:MAG: ABC transporter substrate-binding protein [Bacteroidales bacterium]|nr:ABC transporter substrate-binding protein [Bacteroidales bacterium]
MSKIVYITILIIAIIFTACQSGFDKPEGKTVFRYNESAGISSLDPAFARDQANIWASNQIFNGLVQLDDSLLVKPSIAKSWEILDSGRTYIFHLRSDVVFHDNACFMDSVGRKMIAADVEYSLKRVINIKTLSPGAVWLSNLLRKDSVDTYAIYPINDSTISIKLKQAFSPFLGRLSMQYFSVIPHEAVNLYGKDFSRHPVGTGPFYFKLWKEGVKLVLLKNEKYFESDNKGKLPHLDAVAISFIIDKQSVFLEFVKGNIDFISGIDPSYKDELLQGDGSLNPKYKGEFMLMSAPYLNTEYLGIMVEKTPLMQNSPLRLRKIRQAINYSFDRKKMMRYLRNNIGIAGNNGFVPVGMPGFENGITQGYNYNPDKARQLLMDAGFPNGEGMPVITLSTTAAYLDICKYIQQQAEQVGISMEVDVNQAAALRQMIANSKMPFFRGSWIADYADPENYLALFYSPNFCPAGANYTHYSNPKFDLMYEKARGETDLAKRLQLYREMDQMVINDAPVVVLYYDKVLRFVQNNIQGLGINSMNLLQLKNVVKTEK